MSPDITHPLDDLAVYALDALDDHERAFVDAHLATCAACRAELDQHLATLSQLTTPDEPPPELWDRIARQTAAMPRAVAAGAGGRLGAGAGAGQAAAPVVPLSAARQPSAPPTPPTGPALAGPTGPAADRRPDAPGEGSWVPRHRARHRRPPTRPLWLAGVAAAVVVLAGIAGAILLAQGGDDGSANVAELAQAAAEDPDATVVTLTAADGGGETRARIVTTGDPTGYVLLDELPQLPEGHTYQVWNLDDPNVPVSLGVLGDGSSEAAAIGVPEGTTAFAITDESVPGGVPAPLGPIVAQATA